MGHPLATTTGSGMRRSNTNYSSVAGHLGRGIGMLIPERNNGNRVFEIPRRDRTLRVATLRVATLCVATRPVGGPAPRPESH